MKSSIYSKDHLYVVAQLKRARRTAGLNQQTVADKLGRTQSSISKIEAGQRRIDVVQLKRFAQLYEKPLEYFIE